MPRRRTPFRVVLVLLTVCLGWCGFLGTGPAGAAPVAAAVVWTDVAPGVRYRQVDAVADGGPVRAHLLEVDLREPGVSVALLYPGVVGARAKLSALANGSGAVAGINGDFFHISETQHADVDATGAPVGPAVANGQAIKAAVPKGQRFGPALPPGTSSRDVLGVGMDGVARLDRLTLDGAARLPGGELPLGGLNQYALPVGSVGAFTADWGASSRLRATCGTDTNRAAPCSAETREVTIRSGRVVAVATTPGRGWIPKGTEVLVGREAGARALRALKVGDPVTVRHSLVATASEVPFRFAIGGFPVLRGGQPLAGLDTVTAAVRTAAGISDGGHGLLLLALDGAKKFRSGLTLAEAAELMADLGAVDAFSLDGGGSSTLVSRSAGAATVTVRNHPSGGVERAVANGIGVYTGA